MRTMRAVSIIGVMVVFAALMGCRKSVDVVSSISPVSEALSDVRVTMEQLARLLPEHRLERLQRDWPHLQEEIAYYARQHRLIPETADVGRIEFLFGSLDRVRANDSAGVSHEGYFRDQLVARLHVRGQDRPVDVIVQCLNGVFIDPKDLQQLQSLGTFVPVQRFTIGPREGLVHHVDYPLAIDLAKRFSLPLYRGWAMIEEDLITPEQARVMEPITNRVQVAVKVFEGDQFDLVAGTYTPAPKKLAPSRKVHRSKGTTKSQRLGGRR